VSEGSNERRPVTARSCVASTLLALLLACGGSPERPGDILLITVDTLRPDHLGLYGYERTTSPEIDRWFADAAIFERAYTTNAHTPPSVVSILTGQLPQEHGVRLFYQLLPEGVLLIPDHLPDSYQTAAFVSNVALTEEALGIASHFDHFDDRVDEKEPHRRVYERNARRTTNAALLWLAEYRNPERLLFLWVHYIDPHGPYRPPSGAVASFQHEGRVPMENKRILSFQREKDVEDALDYVDRYDEEIAYVDAQIGRLLDGYARRHDPASALMIFSADHGESMIEHERWFTHGYQVYEEIIRIPLMILGPGVEGGRRQGLVSIIDLMPTILHFAGVSAPGLAGQPLQRGPEQESSDRTVFAEGGPDLTLLRAAIQGERKWVTKVRVGKREPTQHEFFDLADDPGETAPQEWAPGEAAEGALELLRLIERDPDPGGRPESLRKGEQLTAPKVAPRADQEAIERLRALGYVE
jgi:arylsulfatase A-like enzyme